MAKDDLIEIGSSGLRKVGGVINEEFLPNLRGKRGAKVYREMVDNDPVIGSILFSIEKIITRLEWRIDPFDDSPEAVAAQEFVQSCMDDMSDSWDSTLQSILSMLPYGWSYHEVVYKRRGGESNDPTKRSKFEDGKIGWRKWAIRSQDTLWKWDIDHDGGIQGMIQMDPWGQRGQVIIPIDKALLFRTSAQKNNPEGRSLLRTAYRPWYFKRRIEEIEAIGIERDLAGLPIAFLPPEYLSSGATEDQKRIVAMMESIVQNVKRNEQEGLVFPLIFDERGNKMFDIQLLSAGGSRQFDTDKVISRYDQRIAMSVLSDFILLGHENVGSFALSSDKTSLFSVALGSLLSMIEDVFNTYAVPRLFAMNPEFKLDELPRLKHGDIEQPDLAALAQWIGALTAAGETLFPDERLSKWSRQVAGMPEPSEDRQAPEDMMDTMAPPAPAPAKPQQEAPDKTPLDLAEPDDGSV